jgi:hypothetical protein
MNQTLLAIIVKICGPILTIPTRFVDLLWRVAARADWSLFKFVPARVASEFNPVPV